MYKSKKWPKIKKIQRIVKHNLITKSNKILSIKQTKLTKEQIYHTICT